MLAGTTRQNPSKATLLLPLRMNEPNFSLMTKCNLLNLHKIQKSPSPCIYAKLKWSQKMTIVKQTLDSSPCLNGRLFHLGA